MTTAGHGFDHVQSRPTWVCRMCGRPWPCATARSDLTAEFEGFPSTLVVYMTGQMHDALLDLTAAGAPPPSDLYERFLGWVARRHP